MNPKNKFKTLSFISLFLSFPRSFQPKRNPNINKKLNTPVVNDQFQGMTVSSINYIDVNKRMVTWKDTLPNSSRIGESGNLPLQKEMTKKNAPKGIHKGTLELNLKSVVSKINTPVK